MKQLPAYLTPINDNKQLYYTQECMELLRKDMTMFILTKNLTNDFYNLSNFFLKHKINDDIVKKSLNETIIQELKDFGWTIANVFNNTGIIVCEDTEQLEKSVWKSTLDFNIR